MQPSWANSQGGDTSKLGIVGFCRGWKQMQAWFTKYGVLS